jgi:hypothetical protein
MIGCQYLITAKDALDFAQKHQAGVIRQGVRPRKG